jgi:hypothetical protein
MASDSRISWGDSHSWDQGRKTFASRDHPFIFGFVGDVLFPTLALAAVVDRLDRGMLAADPFKAFDQMVGSLVSLWNGYPAQERRPHTIYIAFRAGEGMKSSWHLRCLNFSGGDNRGCGNSNLPWKVDEIPMPERSAILKIGGSGSSLVKDTHLLWENSSSSGTSRAVYAAFVESVESGQDPKTGGAPQLASIFRVGPAKLMGIVHQDTRYLAGGRLLGTERLKGLEWRNNLFERADGKTKLRLKSAQKHDGR